MAKTLQNYLKTYRKRGGLTQDDMAFLLGTQDGAKVSRYERLSRKPNLQTAFACQVVFGVPAHELFPGLFQEVEKTIINRAHLLYKRLKNGDLTPATGLKVQALDAITSRKADGLAQPI